MITSNNSVSAWTELSLFKILSLFFVKLTPKNRFVAIVTDLFFEEKLTKKKPIDK